MAVHRTRFDVQADGFDERAGVGPAARDIAEGIVALVGAGSILEVGPGTGEIGTHLAAAATRYAGIDASFPMLEAFARRQPPRRSGQAGRPRALLVHADAGRRWPVRDKAVDLVFSSRAAHLLDVDHVAAEVTRVCRPAGHLLVGRVQRQRDGLRNRLRDRRRALLAEQGFAAPEGRDRTRRLLDALVANGATPVERHAVASWTVTISAWQLLDQWDTAATVGGKDIAPEVHAAVMRRLRAEATGESSEETQTYTVDGVRLPQPTEST